jgi:hypothetical protein
MFRSQHCAVKLYEKPGFNTRTTITIWQRNENSLSHRPFSILKSGVKSHHHLPQQSPKTRHSAHRIYVAFGKFTTIMVYLVNALYTKL